MPRYDYNCQDCGRSFDVRMSMSEYSSDATPECPSCGSANSARSFSSVGVLTGSRGGSGSRALPTMGGGCGHGGFT